MSMKFLKTVAGAAVSSLWEKVSGNVVLKDTDANVGIGETAPANKLHVKVSDVGIAPHGSSQIALERDGTNYLQFLTANTGTSGLLFGDTLDVDVAKIVYDHIVPHMVFTTEAAAALTIDGSQDVTINTGNLVIGTAGKGIDFRNQASPTDGMTSELLDRYEEGTWDPAITGPSSISYDTQAGAYTRVGNLVTVGFEIRATWTGDGAASMTGLPFAIGAPGLTIVPAYQSFETGIIASAYSIASGTTATFYELNALSVAWVPPSGTSQYIIGSGSYFV